MNRALLLLIPALAACTSLDNAREDLTHLEGEVPTGLGRDLEVHMDGVDDELKASFLAALEREFVGRDLFDTVAPVESRVSGRVPGAGLWLTLVSSEVDDIYDLMEFTDAHTVRYELEIELRDADEAPVLFGHVTGIGVDDVSEPDYVTDLKREDIRLAAIHDAANKIARGLRRTAFVRQTKALKDLGEIGLPAGMGPLPIAVLGFDDAPNAFRLRGTAMTDMLTDTLIRLGSDFDVTAHDRAQIAVEREPPKGFYGIADFEVALIGQHLTARVFVVGEVKLTGGKVEAQARLVDRRGKVLASRSAKEEGLGALPIVAVKLAWELGVALQEMQLSDLVPNE